MARLDAPHRQDRRADTGQTLAQYVADIGDRWTRAIDPTSTYDPYAAGLRRRVVPTLGHLPLTMITAGLVDRAIDRWEAGVRPLDGQEHRGRAGAGARRGGARRLARAEPSQGPRPPAHRRARGNSAEPGNPRDLALPDVATLERLVERGHRGRQTTRRGATW